MSNGTALWNFLTFWSGNVFWWLCIYASKAVIRNDWNYAMSERQIDCCEENLRLHILKLSYPFDNLLDQWDLNSKDPSMYLCYLSAVLRAPCPVSAASCNNWQAASLTQRYTLFLTHHCMHVARLPVLCRHLLLVYTTLFTSEALNNHHRNASANSYTQNSHGHHHHTHHHHHLGVPHNNMSKEKIRLGVDSTSVHNHMPKRLFSLGNLQSKGSCWMPYVSCRRLWDLDVSCQACFRGWAHFEYLALGRSPCVARFCRPSSNPVGM